MELLEVDCGNGVERRIGPLNMPQPTSPSLGMANSEGNVSLLPSLSPICGSVVGCSNERWLVADCDLCAGGFGCAGRGPVEERRWIRGVTEGDNLITAFYLLSSSSSTLAGSLTLPPTSCRYGNLRPAKKPSTEWPDGVKDTCWGFVYVFTTRTQEKTNSNRWIQKIEQRRTLKHTSTNIFFWVYALEAALCSFRTSASIDLFSPIYHLHFKWHFNFTQHFYLTLKLLSVLCRILSSQGNDHLERNKWKTDG